MADLNAGTQVRALDYPPAVKAFDHTDITDISSTSYTGGVPNLTATFQASTTGRVVLTVGAGVRDSGATNRVFVALQVREDNATGAIVLSPSVAHAVSNVNASNRYEARTRSVLLEGLEPGRTYFVRTMHRVDGAATADITARYVQVTPAA